MYTLIKIPYTEDLKPDTNLRFLLALALILLTATGAWAGPIFPSRVLILAPQFRSANDTVKGAIFLSQQGIWGDISHAFQSNGDRYFWSISTGGIIQFVEWEHSAIYLVGDYEMTADQHSDIDFHPRGIFWTEGVMYMDKIGETEIHTGYINRCHHDIDDLETQTVGNAEERTLIYSSLLMNLVWRDVNLAGFHSALSTQLDWYVFRQDYLIPAPTQEPATDFEHIIGSLSTSVKIDIAHLGDATGYLRASATNSVFNKFKTTTFDAREELGMQFEGSATAMNIYLGAESLQDDGTRPIPVNSKFVFLGLRFIGRNVGL